MLLEDTSHSKFSDPLALIYSLPLFSQYSLRRRCRPFFFFYFVFIIHVKWMCSSVSLRLWFLISIMSASSPTISCWYMIVGEMFSLFICSVLLCGGNIINRKLQYLSDLPIIHNVAQVRLKHTLVPFQFLMHWKDRCVPLQLEFLLLFMTNCLNILFFLEV